MKINPATIKILTVCYILLLAGIIYVANRRSTQYLLNFIGNIPYGDKLGHFFLMGILSFLVNILFSARSVGFGKYRYLLGSLLVWVVVTIEEVSQIFISGRTFSSADLVADSLGIIVFGELARLICLKFLGRKQV